jgi:hypothetical protein
MWTPQPGRSAGEAPHTYALRESSQTTGIAASGSSSMSGSKVFI